MKPAKQKIYCYVDETGQDTQGALFLVAVVILQKDIAKVNQTLEDIERTSDKKKRKWFHAHQKRRISYIKQILENPLLQGNIYYSQYKATKNYVDLIILTTAKAIVQKNKKSYEAIVWVDGLKRTERHFFASGLRRLKVRVRKVRGMRDENSSCVRLADSIAGFVRDGLEGNKEMRKLYRQAVRANVIQEL